MTGHMRLTLAVVKGWCVCIHVCVRLSVCACECVQARMCGVRVCMCGVRVCMRVCCVCMYACVCDLRYYDLTVISCHCMVLAPLLDGMCIGM